MTDYRENSAYATWVKAGADWRAENPNATIADLDKAASGYAEGKRAEKLSFDVSKRAFAEGALPHRRVRS